MFRKIFLVTKREYITRVRKKSFIVMTIAAPLLIILFYGVIIYFAVNRDIGASKKEIYVSDESGVFTGKLKNNENISFTYGFVPEAGQQDFLNKEDYYGLLVIPRTDGTNLHKVKLISGDQAALSTVIYIEKQLENEVKTSLLKSNGIDAETLKTINAARIDVETVKSTDKGLESGNVGASTVLGYLGALIIYGFIFIYSVQIMKGVIEEKSNRIVEVIISSVKPFELMFGKIAGIAMVGLTQFSIWILLVTVLGGGVSGMVMQQMGAEAQTMGQTVQASSSDMGEIMKALSGFNFTYLIGMFLFYFLGGYLFYGALFAAIGSAVDNDTDTQQFMLPVTMPLIFALVLAQSAIGSNPNGTLAFWLSIIPFTSPVVMMVRIPFDVPLWQTLLSMASLIAGFIFTTWLAGRIYRVGILMYGKKPSYKLMAKWLFSKE